jgi:hypothetical protein
MAWSIYAAKGPNPHTYLAVAGISVDWSDHPPRFRSHHFPQPTPDKNGIPVEASASSLKASETVSTRPPSPELQPTHDYDELFNPPFGICLQMAWPGVARSNGSRSAGHFRIPEAIRVLRPLGTNADIEGDRPAWAWAVRKSITFPTSLSSGTSAAARVTSCSNSASRAVRCAACHATRHVGLQNRASRRPRGRRTREHCMLAAWLLWRTR